MTTRRRPLPAIEPRPASEPVPDDLRRSLAIDRLDLDEGLLQQPELFDRVADTHVLAIAELDEAKLDLKEAEAEEDAKFRGAEDKVEGGKRVTDTAVARQLALLPRIRDLNRRILRLKAEVDRWAVLKEGFQQRSYALKELARLHVARMMTGNSVGSGHMDVADANRRGLDRGVRRG